MKRNNDSYADFPFLIKINSIPRILIISRIKAHFAQVSEMMIETLHAFAKSAAWKIDAKSHLMGKAIQYRSVRVVSKTVINPPIVMIGTKGTMIRLIKTPVKFVCPIKKRRIGKVQIVAPRVGSP